MASLERQYLKISNKLSEGICHIGFVEIRDSLAIHAHIDRAGSSRCDLEAEHGRRRLRDSQIARLGYNDRGKTEFEFKCADVGEAIHWTREAALISRRRRTRW